MFQLIRFNETPEGVSVVITYDKNNGSEHRIEKSFTTPSQAAVFVNQSELTYYREKLKAFVLHKKVLSEKSHVWASSQTKAHKLHSLSVCIREMEKCQDNPIDIVANVILHLENHLNEIISEGDPGEEPLKLKELLKTANERVYGLKHTIA